MLSIFDITETTFIESITSIELNIILFCCHMLEMAQSLFAKYSIHIWLD